MGYALLLVVLIFGWTGGKLLVTQSYGGAKVKAKEMKSSRGKGQGPASGRRRRRLTAPQRPLVCLWVLNSERYGVL